MEKKALYQRAQILAFITIGYNLLEGIVSIGFGAKDETLALFGFGVDSFVEVLSAWGILQMLYRVQKNPQSDKGLFEVRALKITGVAFYLLTAGLLIGSALSFYSAQMPQSSLMGIIISTLSIGTMYFLYVIKLKTGQQLNSPAIIADAKCTKTCFNLSYILLASSLIYHFFRIPYIDAVGSLGIAWFAFKEGKEAFAKARNECGDCCC